MNDPRGHYNRGGKWCIHCGVTNGRIVRAYVNGTPLPCVRPDTPCGHPLAARAVRFTDSTIPASLRTVCWACEVESERRQKVA
jgi:hypothetical protein